MSTHFRTTMGTHLETPKPALEIRLDDLQGAEVHALLREHMAGMMANSPPESVHALPLDKLRHSSVSFWTAWQGDALCGCGALKQHDATMGEVKSMRTRPAHLRKGVAQAVLNTILSTARERGLSKLYLETGTGPDFEAATALYRRNGFEDCGPFADYKLDPFSHFMVKSL
jgi:putative acetyltransferase